MEYWPKSPAKQTEKVADTLAGGDVMDAIQSGKGDLSDWIELMDAVEALCPVWPAKEQATGGVYRL